MLRKFRPKLTPKSREINFKKIQSLKRRRLRQRCSFRKECLNCKRISINLKLRPISISNQSFKNSTRLYLRQISKNLKINTKLKTKNSTKKFSFKKKSSNLSNFAIQTMLLIAWSSKLL